ncbi:AAA family ATPase [Legionella saoudiensis]|uniref:AAA family ATPase n=1 Tax=Legionella saoudiensis TaxID=1750561 RepID=UPI000730BCFC|nr:AAA family ATPase [Legionella saoudiensis]
MSVLKEILEWSQERPDWQRDALRRLVLNDELSEDDLKELGEICKSAHGLSEQQDTLPLMKDHIPSFDTTLSKVVLDSIYHHRGVNALAERQTLRFSSSLTVVYGDNAAGKTGYIRILKSACRARGKEKILGNVVSGGTPYTPTVSIKYKVGDESNLHEWAGEGDDDYISRVSVFDTQSAAVYLTEKTDVAFRPFGLDLFDKLVKACKAIRLNLEKEKSAISTNGLYSLLSRVPDGSHVAKFLSHISSLTKPEDVQSLAQFSLEEESNFSLLEKSLQDLQAKDTEKLVQQMFIRARRIRSFTKHLQLIETTLSEKAVSAVFDARMEGIRKRDEAKRLREVTFPEGMLEGTGSEIWSQMWEAAQRFSDELAYQGKEFPVVENDAQCVLCQQNIDHAAAHRLKQFKTFVASTTERELRKLRDEYVHSKKLLVELQIQNETIQDTLKEIRIEDEDLADSLSTALDNNESRRTKILTALNENQDISSDCPPLELISIKVEALAVQLEERIKTLSNSAQDEEKKKRIILEVQEFRARKILAEHVQLVLDEIERKKKLAAFELCLNDTKTQSITQKSTSVTKNSVTSKLKKSFRDELDNLAFRHVEVELSEAGGAEGVQYHKLTLTRAPGVELPRVVSEGEQRCLSIAAFFAELSTADDLSGIIFDDPVSSLDYKWREGVAKRLVIESQKRQVIVFTHDVVFLLLLKQVSEERGVEQFDQHIRQLSIGAGVCAEDLPWVALPIKKKISFLKKQYQDAEKLYREGHQTAYEKEASYVYGMLREAWERALEEVLLGGVVERYRPSIQTQQVKQVADITEEDCKILSAAMTKCSKWLPGHDQAAAARAELPEPDVLKTDIDELEKWVSAIRKRRN